MTIFTAILFAVNTAIVTPVCKVKPNYDNELCHISEEDRWWQNNFAYTEGRVRGLRTYFEIETIPFSDGFGKKLWIRSGEVKESFMKMISDAKKKGLKFGVNSSYRTWKHQMRLYREMPDVACDPWEAGERSHMTGYSIDFSGTYAFVPFEKINPKWFSDKYAKPVEGGFLMPTKFFWWLKANAHKYGFKNTVKSEPWHWKYVGEEEGVRLVSK